MIQDNPKWTTLLLTYRQINGSPTVRDTVYVILLTSSHHVGILPSHIITGRRKVSTVQLERERETTFTELLLEYVVIIVLLCY